MAVHELAPADALARQQAGALLVDVREAHERALGTARNALGVARADLEADPAAHLPALDTEILLICQSGRRSQFAADALAARGYTNLASVVGGTLAWSAAGLPMDAPALDDDFSDRYSRHLRLPEVGLAGQAMRVFIDVASRLDACSWRREMYPSSCRPSNRKAVKRLCVLPRPMLVRFWPVSALT